MSESYTKANELYNYLRKIIHQCVMCSVPPVHVIMYYMWSDNVNCELKICSVSRPKEMFYAISNIVIENTGGILFTGIVAVHNASASEHICISTHRRRLRKKRKNIKHSDCCKLIWNWLQLIKQGVCEFYMRVFFLAHMLISCERILSIVHWTFLQFP